MEKQTKKQAAVIVLLTGSCTSANYRQIPFEVSTYIMNRFRMPEPQGVDTFITWHAGVFMQHLPFACRPN